MANEHYFYVLFCKDQTFYGGYTTDLSRRLEEHNNGTGAKYTRLQKRRPVKMIHAEVFSSRSEATKAEAAFKKLTRKQKERYLQTHSTGKYKKTSGKNKCFCLKFFVAIILSRLSHCCSYLNFLLARLR